MSLLGHYDVDTLPQASGYAYNDCWGFTDCGGREYAILGSARYVHFFDLQDPFNPLEVAAIGGGATTLWREMRTFGQRAYTVCDNCDEGLLVFDLSQLPDTVVKTNQTTGFFKSSHTLFIDEEAGWLYAAGTDFNNNGLVILDLNSDPDNPVQIGNPVLPGGYVHDMYVRDNIGFCSHGNNGYYVYDFSNPQNPLLLGTLTNYPQDGYNHSSWMTPDGQYMVMCDETWNKSVKMVDVSNPSDMHVTDLFRSALLGPADTASIAHNPLVRENFAFISYYHDGVQVFDISDPTNVQQVAWYDTHPANTNYSGFQGCWGVFAFLPSGTILGSDMKNGLFIFSLDSILLDPIDVPAFPDPVITASGDPLICEGETIGLTADSGITSIDWYLDGEPLAWETAGIEVGEAGIYTATLQDQYCVTQSDSLSLQVQEPPLIDVTYMDSLACQGDTILLSASAGLESWQWNLGGAPIENAVQSTWPVSVSGLYSVTGVSGPCSATSEPVWIEVAEPVVPLLTFENDTLFSTSALAYQWYFNGIPVSGGTGPFLVPGESGMYWVETTDGNGCNALSEGLEVGLPNFVQEGLPRGWKIFPNPARELVYIENPGQTEGFFTVTDLFGRKVVEGRLQTHLYPVDLGGLAEGMYLFSIRSAGIAGFEKIWVR